MLMRPRDNDAKSGAAQLLRLSQNPLVAMRRIND
jgi:hypothetical protein